MAKETLGATVSVFLLLGGIEAALYTYGTSVSLHKTLLQNYSKDIRPVTNQTKTLLIDIKLNIKAINKFDETETYSVWIDLGMDRRINPVESNGLWPSVDRSTSQIKSVDSIFVFGQFGH